MVRITIADENSPRTRTMGNVADLMLRHVRNVVECGRLARLVPRRTAGRMPALPDSSGLTGH